MTVLPVIVRELRASARQPFTYYLRLLGVTAVLLMSLLFGLQPGAASVPGQRLFVALHCTLLGSIWVLVPMLTADCISRERREGTLGLLFMTPLKGTDIVVAKALSQGLRAITLWLAALPVLAIPFLMGGVSWAQAALSVAINANAMGWALAAGLLASAWSKSWPRALLGAAILAFAFLVILGMASGWLVIQEIHLRKPGRFFIYGDSPLPAGFFLLANGEGFWSHYFRWMSGSGLAKILGQTTLLSLLALVVAVLVAGARTRRSWREVPPPRWQAWLERIFCTPVLWVSFFRRWMGRKLERNPIGWLEQRTWGGRLVTWGWLAVLISVYSTMFTDRYFFRVANPIQELMAWLLAGSMAASAAGSFQRERETGVLELLLVSPLGESQIISGRLRGLWGQFFPAAGLLLAVWAYCSSFLPDGPDAGVFAYYAATFVSVPVFGLYYSLRCRNFLTAFLFTTGVGLLLSLFLVQALMAAGSAYVNSTPFFFGDVRAAPPAAGCQVFLALCCWWLLRRRLKQRAFPLERTAG